MQKYQRAKEKTPETLCMRTFSCCSNPPLIGSIYIASHTAHTGDAPGRWIAPKTVNGPLRESLTHSHIDREVSHRVPRAASVSRASRPCHSQVSVVDRRRTTVYYVLRYLACAAS